jgi:hypothetical protein
MEIKRDFGKRMTSLAESLPREVLASLLTRLMPVEQVTTRPPTDRAATPDATATASRDPFVTAAARRSRRRPKSFAKAYRVLRSLAAVNHRRGTWTYAMVRAAAEHDNTADAEAWLRTNYPQFDHKVIDWGWLAGVKEYITFNL